MVVVGGKKGGREKRRDGREKKGFGREGVWVVGFGWYGLGRVELGQCPVGVVGGRMDWFGGFGVGKGRKKKKKKEKKIGEGWK